jgi:hypothetical protein
MYHLAAAAVNNKMKSPDFFRTFLLQKEFAAIIFAKVYQAAGFPGWW